MNNSSKWRLSYTGPALVVSSGLVYTQQTKPKGLTLNIILEMIQEHPRTAHYEKKLKRRLTLADSLSRNTPEDIGKVVELSSSIDLYRLEHDREFNKLPKTGEQLLANKHKSKPKKVTEA